MDSFKWIWSYLKAYKFRFFIGVLMILVVSALHTINPKIAGIIVDRVIEGGETGLLANLLLIMIGITIVRSALTYYYQISFHKISQGIIFKIRRAMYEKVQQLDFHFFDKNKTGEIMSRMTGDLEAVRHFTAWVSFNVVSNLILLVIAIILLFSINTLLTFLMLAITPVLGFTAYKMAMSVKPAFSAIREQFAKLNSVVKENISGNRVVKAFAKEAYEIEKFRKENEDFKQINVDSAKIWAKFLPVMEMLAGMLTVFLILAGGILVIRGSLTLGELVTFNGLVWTLSMPMRMSGWLINDIQRFGASAERIMELLDTQPLVANNKEYNTAKKIKGTVEFRNVSFSYGDEKVLENVSFTAKEGETIAILGPTGSGKSSIINLICRYYEADSGEVFVDGTNIKDIDLKILRKMISVAMQDVFLFSNTIEGNIAYGCPDIHFDKVVNFAEMADAHEFIKTMPQQYQTIVGERGVGLSGGQRQRISLARALITNPSILILDDTTSSVDLETEKIIYSAMNSYRGNRTTFIIAHRISTIKDADQILVIQDGTIIERGTHVELLERKGYYYDMFISQVGEALA